MSAVEAGLVAQLVLATAGVVAATALPARSRNVGAGAAIVGLGLAGVVTGAIAWAGGSGALRIRTPLPISALEIAPDRLGGVFLVLVGGVAATAALYAISYAHGAAASRTGWTAFALFVLGLQIVMAAADAVTFLLGWEVMALASTVLVLADHATRPSVVPAGLWYAVMTHLSFALLLVGFGVLAATAGGTAFADLATVDPRAGVSGVAFVLLLLGFATKAGAVPLHVWLPKAHPEAPSHVSAVMSAAMVKAGVYGVLLLVVRLLPRGPAWWGLLILAIAAASAVYAILQASVASDLKRLLAHSTTENVGLMLLAIAVAQVLRAAGATDVAGVALVAAVLLALAHAAAKVGLFLGAGAIVHAARSHDLDDLGGLTASMPWTAVTFGVCALGAAALPISAGFVAEWVLLQALIHGGLPNSPVVAVVMPVAVSVVALTAGLALLTVVKAFGIAFLGRARSAAAANAQEAPPLQKAAMVVAAVGVVVPGLVCGPIAAAVARATGVSGVEPVGLLGVRLTAVRAVLDPVALALLAAGVAVPIVAAAVARARRAPRRDVDLAWGCGGARVSPRMQYTATSYAEPLVRVFDVALQASRAVETTPAGQSPYLEQEVRFRQRLEDVVEQRVYLPVVAAMVRVGESARRVQNGSLYRYLGFSFAALVVVLMVVTR